MHKVTKNTKMHEAFFHLLLQILVFKISEELRKNSCLKETKFFLCISLCPLRLSMKKDLGSKKPYCELQARSIYFNIFPFNKSLSYIGLKQVRLCNPRIVHSI